MSNTCATCKHIGSAYWGESWNREHFCGKSRERRADQFRTSGDFATDFMSEFRKFFDARAKQAACSYYEERPLLPSEDLSVLAAISAAGGEAIFGFFSDENSRSSRMRDKFVEGGHCVSNTDGSRKWSLTAVGRAELTRAMPTASPSHWMPLPSPPALSPKGEGEGASQPHPT